MIGFFTNYKQLTKPTLWERQGVKKSAGFNAVDLSFDHITISPFIPPVTSFPSSGIVKN